MKNFRTLDQAKKDLQVYLNYIDLIENYKPETLVQHTIKIYALEGSLKRTAELLNQFHFTIDGRLIEPQDVTTLILSKPSPADSLHKEIKRLYLKKTKPSRRSFTNSYY